MKIIITLIALISTGTFSWIQFKESDSEIIKEEIQRVLHANGIDLAQLKQLTLSGKELENLDQIRRATAVEDLNLSDNQIGDLEPLGQLENLIVLDLSKNQITDLTPLKGMTKLNYLNLNQNQVESLEPLKNIPGLVGLILAGNNHVDLGPLMEMKNLRSLYLSPGPNLSQANFDQIQKALPNCKVTVAASTK